MGLEGLQAANSSKLLRIKAEQALVLGPGLAALLLILMKGRNPRTFTTLSLRGSGPSRLRGLQLLEALMTGIGLGGMS